MTRVEYLIYSLFGSPLFAFVIIASAATVFLSIFW